ncbi:glutamate binding protein [Gautieria morchelliformis]|nr:glutamate binding protein [Gautieria morchelliformis]
MSTAPPLYQDASSQPLLNNNSGPSTGGIYNQPDDGDLPDDFKYGVSVSESAPEIRAAFVRKVYTILFCQILATCVVGGTFSQNTNAIVWVQTHSWSLIVTILATFPPLNLVFLSSFTVLEAFTLGFVIAFYNTNVVLQALLITLGIFLGLTLFTFQSKWDFSGMGPFLLAGILALVMTGFVGMFFPFSKTWDLVYGIAGALLFSGYIVFDTYLINKRYSPDEFIMGSISLYLDFINLFLSILRILNNIQDN